MKLENYFNEEIENLMQLNFSVRAILFDIR